MSAATHVNSWYAASAPQIEDFPRLEGEVEADVCIVGGGFTGLSSAIHLRDKGYSVVLLEAERVAWGASGRNGGHCSTGQRAYAHISRWDPAALARPGTGHGLARHARPDRELARG